MSSFIQQNRNFGLITALGADVLLLSHFEGAELLCGLYQFNVHLLSENDGVEARQLIGRPMAIWIQRPDGQIRWIHGMVNRFEYIGRNDRLSQYRAQIVPLQWVLSQNSDCRIFQDKTVKEIIAEVMKRRGVDNFDDSGVTGDYKKLDYCVQYNESDFAFISRLMESVGIFYFFRHMEDRHQMILGDSNSVFQAGKDPEVNFTDNLSQRSQTDSIWKWEHSYEFRPGKWAHKDFNFETPQDNLFATVNSVVNFTGNSAIEVYEYPGGFEVTATGSSLAKVRMEAEEAHHDIVQGESYCQFFAPGVSFRMKDHHSPREANREYVITSVRHQVDAAGRFTTGGTSASEGYENAFSCVPKESPYHPLRQTQVPRVYGTQTAIVVGPKGEEIHTDKYGRVKVQFHWDREGKFDENSSCWLRVSQIHAGKGWGMMDLPRIGEEVIVSFLEGDPDRPLIVGRVYNGVNNVPFSLPAEKTRRGNMTKTYKGAGYNEMSMDDTPGKEQLRITAQYNMNSNVNNDQTLDVGKNQTEKVGVDRTREVGNNENVTVGVNKSVTVGTNHDETVGVNQTVKVGTNQSTSVGTSQSNSVGMMKNETVGMMSNEMVGVAKTLNVGAAYSIISGGVMNVAVGFAAAEEVGGTKKIVVGSSFEITCGSSKLTMDAGGKVTISGTEFNFSASGPVKINGSIIDLN